MKVYATYLPGFHQDPFNDLWWGEGFNEWQNVLQSKPLYDSHQQPYLPLNGTYDLNDPNIIKNQFKLANEYGIDAFFIYGYWSLGKQPLLKPLKNIINDKEVNVKFSYFWGNHSWTRSWTNRSGASDVLLLQEYSLDADLTNFCIFLSSLFNDDRYEKINNRPIFTIYRPNDIPNLELYLEKFREFFEKNYGYNPYIIGCITTWQASYKWMKNFDNTMLFQPSASLFGTENPNALPKQTIFSSIELYIRSLPDTKKKIIYKILDALPSKHKIWNYSDISKKSDRQIINFHQEFNTLIPMICAGFDNTPRYKKRAKILGNFSITAFEESLKSAVDIANKQKNPMVVVNAWNEWGEGMAIEPDTVHKYKKLEIIKKVKINK